ncbi:hypothetical protein IQ250_10020, partial [Pseudanabaenaceae cyanobacterium LEGE 13415]|nr:hypothetical protein [Pseudanabaenaceae cyanobacterium LEGE 13415]
LLTAGRSRPTISRLESPKSSAHPVYQKSWIDRWIPLLIVLGGLAVGWTVAHSLIVKAPQSIQQK